MRVRYEAYRRISAGRITMTCRLRGGIENRRSTYAEASLISSYISSIARFARFRGDDERWRLAKLTLISIIYVDARHAAADGRCSPVIVGG